MTSRVAGLISRSPRERRTLARLRAFAVAPEHGPHARQELGHAEGLGDVVLGAELEAHHLVHLRAARGEHRDRHFVALAAQCAEHLEAVQPREHHVEDDEIDRRVARLGEPFFAVVGEEHVDNPRRAG